MNIEDASFYSEEEVIKNEKDLVVERVPTGIPKLDELLQGGFPKRSITLVSGPPGSGKTMLCFHFVDEGIKRGERCLYITVDQWVNSILVHSHAAGFNFLPAIDNGLFKLMHVDLEKVSAYNEISDEILTGGYQRIVVDSLSPFADTPLVLGGSVEFEKAPIIDKLSAYPSETRPVARFHVRRLFDFLHKVPTTAMVTSELFDRTHSLSRDSVSEFLADGVILLDVDPTMDRRKLTIWKMRGTKHTLKPHDVLITEQGLVFKNELR